MGPPVAWFYEGQLRPHQNWNWRMMTPSIEFILNIFSKKNLIADFYDVSGRRKMELKCTKIRLLTV